MVSVSLPLPSINQHAATLSSSVMNNKRDAGLLVNLEYIDETNTGEEHSELRG